MLWEGFTKRKTFKFCIETPSSIYFFSINNFFIRNALNWQPKSKNCWWILLNIWEPKRGFILTYFVSVHQFFMVLWFSNLFRIMEEKLFTMITKFIISFATKSYFNCCQFDSPVQFKKIEWVMFFFFWKLKFV